MAFRSHLARDTKRERALVLALAAAELLVRGGERVGLLGLTRPTASRRATTRLAEAIAANIAGPVLTASLPPPERIGRFSGVIVFGDFLDPAAEIVARFQALAGEGVLGHVVQVLDPAEETLPYEGRAEFLGLEGEARWIADRTESLRGRYQSKLAAHRGEIAAGASRLGWSFLLHHTDRPAAEPLLALLAHLQSAARPGRGAGLPRQGASA
jgi:uncharacterized protein (DUF58 family)